MQGYMGSRDVGVQGVQEVKCCRGSKGAGGAKVQGEKVHGVKQFRGQVMQRIKGYRESRGQGMQGVKGCIGERGVGGQGYRGVKDAGV